MSDTTEPIYNCAVIEDRKWLNDAVCAVVGWVGKHRLKWLAVFIMKSYMFIVGEFKCYHVKGTDKKRGD